MTGSPSSARRTSTTWSRSSARSTPAASRCRCSTRRNPATSAGCTPCSTTAAASAILTTTESAEGVRKFFRSRPAKERPRVIAVDAVPDEVGATWEHVDVTAETIAYLQYTSGSTRIPTGVQITHLNLATNVVQVIEALDGEEGDRGV